MFTGNYHCATWGICEPIRSNFLSVPFWFLIVKHMGLGEFETYMLSALNCTHQSWVQCLSFGNSVGLLFYVFVSVLVSHV